MSILPLFYYPTKIVWVDDDEVLLQASTEIFSDANEIQTFSSPISCLHFFSTYVPFLKTVPFLRGKVECDDYDTINHFPVDINSELFERLPMQLERKNEVSIIIIDYRMPLMTGIELCRQLKHVPAKKILLTGDADTACAVSAFNEGIIDCYIRKDNPNIRDEINEYLEILSNNYFSDQSKSLLTHFETDRKIPLSDPVFVRFFKKWCKINEIKEHYVFDKQGNMQLINRQGRKSLFIIHTDRSLNEFNDLYQDGKNIKRYLAEVNERKIIPFFGLGMEAWQFDASRWGCHMFEPNMLVGREKYYWFHHVT